MPLRAWWVRWYEGNSALFEYHGPWWEAGVSEPDGDAVLVAAVMARDEEHAKEILRNAHDDKTEQEWSFVEERTLTWVPWCERFPRAPWMRWPWPKPEGP